MPIQEWNLVVAGVCLVGSLGLASMLLWRDRSSEFYQAVSTMIVAASGISFSANMVLAAGEWWWKQSVFLGELLQGLALCYLAKSFVSPADAVRGQRSIRDWRLACGICLVGAGLLAVLVLPGVERWAPPTVIDLVFKAELLTILLGLVWGVARLEETFRGLRDSARYHAKFVFVGVGGLAVLEVYQASEMFLLSSIRLTDLIVRNLVVAVCGGLIGFGLIRWRIQSLTEKVYLSPHVISSSVSTIAIGLYLITVGVVAQWISARGGDLSTALSIAVVFWALLALVVGVASRSVRARLRLFLSRHIYRSKYDYRQKWLEVTNAFEHAGSVDAILDRLCDLLGKTFSAPRISVWMRFETDQRYYDVRSINAGSGSSSLEVTDPLVAQLLMSHEPVVFRESIAQGAGATEIPRNERLTRAELGIPIWADKELLAFIVMSKEVSGEAYGTDDLDLLRVMASHVGLLLSNAKLAESRTIAAEMEALHRFSAFCLHDLKNLAARLSLVLQNADVHGGNPDFQKAALKTVAGTVGKITALITKLSLPQGAVYGQDLTDVNDLIQGVAVGIREQGGVSVEAACGSVPPVRVNREQLQSVLVNLILNARQAAGEEARIDIRTCVQDGRAVIIVDDTGPGIAPEQLRRLFQPFQTTKREGMGIGLYQCKQMIEGHGGSIQISSRLGMGTTVRLELPVAQGQPSSEVKRGDHMMKGWDDAKAPHH